MNDNDTEEPQDYADRRGDSGNGRDEEHLLHHEITRAIIGAFYCVQEELGSGFLEGVYANAIVVVLRRSGHNVQREVRYDVMFRGTLVGRYRADLVVDSKVVVEVKTVRALDASHIAQVINYLRAANLHVGMLLNFAAKSEFKRIVN